MKDAEQIARETVRAWHAATPKIHGELWSLADHIARSLRSAHAAGYAEAREQAATTLELILADMPGPADRSQDLAIVSIRNMQPEPSS